MNLRALDRRLIISGGLALLAALILLGLTLFGPERARVGTAVGLLALLVVVQVAILFVRPVDRSPLGVARQMYTAGDYADAARLLESIVASQEKRQPGRPAVRALILLGNTYRQVGRLSDSQSRLERALQAAPKNAFALYGLGRTQLASGAYEAAADLFDRALAAHAPSGVACELGLAEYLSGNTTAALRTLQKTTRLLQIEPYRAYLTAALLALLIDRQLARQPSATHAAHGGLQTALSNARREIAGRAYWQAEADRHRATPYGPALSVILAETDRLLTDTDQSPEMSSEVSPEQETMP